MSQVPEEPNDWPAPPQRVRDQLCLIVLGCALASPQRDYQMRIVRHRLSVLCVLVASGLLAWIPVDLQALPGAAAQPIALLRAALALLLLGAAWVHRDGARLKPPAYPALALFVFIQCAAFALMQRHVPADAPALLRLGYGLFPFVVGAQLAIFPLPIIATAALSLPVFLLVLLPGAIVPFAAELSPLGSLWLLSLIVIVASWAGASQLALLQGLLQARSDAAHDVLTGLANRRMGLARLDADIALVRRMPEPLAVLALDLDHFKRVNDQHGHATGDRVLVAFAQAMRGELRAGDLGARIGGEEFIAILPATDAAAAAVVGERIRAASAALAVPTDDGQAVRFTISVGVASLQPGEDSTRLLARADGGLYRAKSEGRNRVVRVD
ncbi:MAG: GGDEF domain-containing protein [Xanthomonadales bacterium]|nr:GGDEF domain-containing protein [Xanthomonadales bacterium]